MPIPNFVSRGTFDFKRIAAFQIVAGGISARVLLQTTFPLPRS